MTRDYPDRPIVGVGAVVIRDGAVLLIRRAKPPREAEWSLPGGAQKLGETLREAAKREVAEETGLAIEVVGMIDAVDAISRDDEGRVQYHYTLFDVAAHVAAQWTGGDPAPGGDAAEARWVKLDALDGVVLWDETRRVISQGAAMLAAPARNSRT